MKRFLEDTLGKDAINKIESIKIGIAGCGGLGSNCAFNLVRSGFIRFKIVDSDVVEISNINRQFYFLDQINMTKVKALEVNLKRINPEINIEAIEQRLNRSNAAKVFADCDIVVEALDEPKEKSMLVSSLLNKVKLIVAASGVAGFGSSDQIRIKKINKNLVLVGDFKTGIDKAPAFSPRVNIAAAKQADIILEYALRGPVS